MTGVVAGEEVARSVAAGKQAGDGHVVAVEHQAVAVDSEAAHCGKHATVGREGEIARAGEGDGAHQVAAKAFVLACLEASVVVGYGLGERSAVDASGLAELLQACGLVEPALALELLERGVVEHAVGHGLVKDVPAVLAVGGLGVLGVGDALEGQVFAHKALAATVHQNAEVHGIPGARVIERVGVAPAEVHDGLGNWIHLRAHGKAHHVAVARGAPARVPPGGVGVVLGARPSLHHLGVAVVAARGKDDALGGGCLEVAVGILGDDARDAARLVLRQLHGRRGETHVDVVISALGNLLHLQAHVDARQAGAHAGALGKGGRFVETQLSVDELGEGRHAARGGVLLNLGDYKAVLALVEHFLPEVGGLAGAVAVGVRRLGAAAPVSGALNLVEEGGLVDLGALLALGACGAEALEAATALGHLLEKQHVGAHVGGLECGDEAADASAHDDDVEVLGACDLVVGNGAGLKGDGAARAGASGDASRLGDDAVGVDVEVIGSGGLGCGGACRIRQGACRACGCDSGRGNAGCLDKRTTRDGAHRVPFPLVWLALRSSRHVG